jgi:hypothetical protein
MEQTLMLQHYLQNYFKEVFNVFNLNQYHTFYEVKHLLFQYVTIKQILHDPSSECVLM